MTQVPPTRNSSRHHLCAMACGDARGAHAHGARADDEQIDLVVSHAWPVAGGACLGGVTGHGPSSSSRRELGHDLVGDLAAQVSAPLTLLSRMAGSSAMTFLPSADR